MTDEERIRHLTVYKGGRGGGGPEDPMIEMRVARLESDVAEIRVDIREINRRLSNLEDRFARMEGGFEAMRAQIAALPTVWTFVVALIGSVLASGALTAGIVALFLGTLK